MRIGQGAVPSVDVTDRITRDVGWVADRWLRELRAGRAFGGTIQTISGAGNNSYAQLFNPVGSLITVILYRITFDISPAGLFRLTHYNTALTTLSATTRNLRSGSAAPVAEVRGQADPASLGSAFYLASPQASTFLDPNLTWITELGAGAGVNLFLNVASSTLNASFFWIEI